MEQQRIEGITILGTEEDELNEIGFFRTVLMQASKIAKCIKVMEKVGIKNITINHDFGWSPRINLDFLLSNTWIEGVDIVSNNIDVSNINYLTGLKRIQLADKVKGTIDFNNFKSLEVCAIKWNSKQFLNLDSSEALVYLNLTSFHQHDLSYFKNMEKLKELKLLYSKVESLDGIENLKLVKLFIWSLPRLENIAALDFLRDTLTDLQIYNCKKIKSYNAISDLKLLNRLQIIDSSPLKSASVLKYLNDIKLSYIGVEVEDGNTELMDSMNIQYKKFKRYRR